MFQVAVALSVAVFGLNMPSGPLSNEERSNFALNITVYELFLFGSLLRHHYIIFSTALGAVI